MLSLLFLWPFHLFHYTIRHRPMFVRFLLRLIGDPCIAGLYVLLFISIIYGARAKQYDLTKIHEMPERSVILDRRGEELARMHGEIRDIISLDQVSADFRKAILAREDERFYSHGAFDPIGIVRAAYNNMQGKREGASTITYTAGYDDDAWLGYVPARPGLKTPSALYTIIWRSLYGGSRYVRMRREPLSDKGWLIEGFQHYEIKGLSLDAGAFIEDAVD
jgi:hypothetical protein